VITAPTEPDREENQGGCSGGLGPRACDHGALHHPRPRARHAGGSDGAERGARTAMGRRASTSAARWLLLAGLGWDVPEAYVSARPPDVPRGNIRAALNTCSVPDAHTPIMHEARPARCAGDHRARASSALPSLTRAGQATQRSIHHDCIPAPPAHGTIAKPLPSRSGGHRAAFGRPLASRHPPLLGSLRLLVQEALGIYSRTQNPL
jgi:hypothetical protein